MHKMIVLLVTAILTMAGCASAPIASDEEMAILRAGAEACTDVGLISICFAQINISDYLTHAGDKGPERTTAFLNARMIAEQIDAREANRAARRQAAAAAFAAGMQDAGRQIQQNAYQQQMLNQQMYQNMMPRRTNTRCRRSYGGGVDCTSTGY